MSGRLSSGPWLERQPRLTPPSRRHRAYLLPLLPLLLLAGWIGWRTAGPHPTPATAVAASTLDRYHLVGARGPTCLRLVIGLDVSGSMRDFAAARDAALTQLIAWAKTNLRGDDEVAIVDFALDAAVRLPPTRRDAILGGGGTPLVNDGRDTLLTPALAVADTFPPSQCDAILLLLSDAQISDLPADDAGGRRLLRDHKLHDVRLLVPGDGIEVYGGWSLAFPAAAPVRFDGSDTDSTALAFGRTVASLTGQRLEQR
jgi:hypothetical protein